MQTDKDFSNKIEDLTKEVERLKQIDEEYGPWIVVDPQTQHNPVNPNVRVIIEHRDGSYFVGEAYSRSFRWTRQNDYDIVRYRMNKKDCALYYGQATCEKGPSSEELNIIRDICHEANVNAGWWTDLKTGRRVIRPIPELLCLIHSEISEALEGHRKNLKDTHLTHRPMLEVELADAVIRIMDLAGGYNLDIGGAIKEKLAYNATRSDHKIENRKLDGGKKI